MDPPAPETRNGALCPTCGHAEVDHVYWQPDAICGGWAHCTLGAGDTSCRCWRAWSRLSNPG